MKKTFVLYLFAMLFVTFANSQILFQSDFEVWQNNYPLGWDGLNTSIGQSSVAQSPDAISGTYSLKIQDQFSTSFMYLSSSPFYIMPDKTYEFSFWTKGKGTFLVNIYYGQSETMTIFPREVFNNDDWTEYKIDFTSFILEDSASVELSLGFSNILSANGLLIDNISIKEKGNFNYLDINNILAAIFPTGSLFNSQANLNSVHSGFESSAPLFIVPKSSERASTIFQGNIWVGAKDGNNNLHLAAETFYEKEFSFGPISTNYNSSEFIEKYNKVWKVSKAEIQNHIDNYYIGGYVIPQNILDWPANGDTVYGESQRIAPYCDVNSNGYYDPQNGDYPAIRGDQALFFVFNDQNQDHLSTNGEKLGLEFRAMAYAYENSQDEALYNNIFISYEVVNKSQNTYTDTYLGMFTDFDLGYGQDDYIGYDSLLNLAYAYNGRNLDGPSYSAYSGVPPVQGNMLLSQNASKFIYFKNSTDPELGHPSNPNEYYNFLKGKTRTGNPITYGENGTNQSNPPTNYMYSGFPELGTGWNELTLSNEIGDRRGLISYGPFSLTPNEKICFDFAYPFAKDSNATTPEGSLPLLRQRAAAIQTFYNSQNIDCGYNDVSIRDIGMINQNNFKLYPNPSNGKFIVNSLEFVPNSKIEVYSILGTKLFEREIKSNSQNFELNLNSGLYIYRIKVNSSVVKQDKIIIYK